MFINQDKNSKELEPIHEKECKYFQYGRSEGSPYLFFNYEEFYDLMGHKVIFYPNGVLLALRDEVKDFETSRSYVFFNNEGKMLIETHNRNSVRNPKTNERTLYPPKKDIKVNVFEDFIYVKEIDFETKEENCYFVNVLTGEKHQEVAEGEQLSMDL